MAHGKDHAKTLALILAGALVGIFWAHAENLTSRNHADTTADANHQTAPQADTDTSDVVATESGWHLPPGPQTAADGSLYLIDSGRKVAYIETVNYRTVRVYYSEPLGDAVRLSVVYFGRKPTRLQSPRVPTVDKIPDRFRQITAGIGERVSLSLPITVGYHHSQQITQPAVLFITAVAITDSLQLRVALETKLVQ